MAITASVKVGSSATDIITGVAQKEIGTTIIEFCNTDNSTTEELDIHICKGGAAAADTNKVISKLEIPPHETWRYDIERWVLDPTDVIRAVGATGGLLTAVGSYKVLGKSS